MGFGPRVVAFAVVVVLVSACKQGRKSGEVDGDVVALVKAASVLLRSDEASGSGFLVRHEDDNDYILTNNHVVTSKGARVQTLKVTYFSGTPKEWSADGTVVVHDEAHDLALLRVSTASALAKPLEGADGVEETTPVMVVGFPFGESLGFDGRAPAATIARGSISSVRRNGLGGVEVLQLDINLNPGNSGGPVVDAQGRVVGISVAAIRGTGISFIIPWEHARDLLDGRASETRVDFGGECADECTGKAVVELMDPFNKTSHLELRVVDADDAFLRSARAPPYKAEGFKLAEADRPASGRLILRTDVNVSNRHQRYLQVGYRQDSTTFYSLPFSLSAEPKASARVEPRQPNRPAPTQPALPREPDEKPVTVELGGTWDGPGDTVSVTQSGAALLFRFASGNRGPVSGRLTGGRSLSASFDAQCCSATVPPGDDSTIQWSNGSTWRRR